MRREFFSGQFEVIYHCGAYHEAYTENVECFECLTMAKTYLDENDVRKTFMRWLQYC